MIIKGYNAQLLTKKYRRYMKRKSIDTSTPCDCKRCQQQRDICKKARKKEMIQ